MGCSLAPASGLLAAWRRKEKEIPEQGQWNCLALFICLYFKKPCQEDLLAMQNKEQEGQEFNPAQRVAGLCHLKMLGLTQKAKLS